MNQHDSIQKTAQYMQEQFSGEGTGHDWWHIWRVWQMSIHLADQEGGNRLIIELAALLHDIADHKFHDGDRTAGARAAREWLETLELPEDTIDHICMIVHNVSFSTASQKKDKKNMDTIEGKIVQDADRLDAIGAIGIARAFAYGGYKQRSLYTPPLTHSSPAEKENTIRDNSTIQHFYDKLLLLTDLMNTESARQIAEPRHQFLEQFLQQFISEWNKKDYISPK